MAKSYQGVPSSESKFMYPDDATRLSYDSLAYSEVTGEPRGMNSISAESLRLNGYLPSESSLLLFTQTSSSSRVIEPFAHTNSNNNNSSNQYRPTRTTRLVDEPSEWFQQPRVRTCYFIAVTLALTTVLVLSSGVLDTEWLENLYTIGVRGMRAQGIADASFIKTRIQGPRIFVGNSHRDQLTLKEGEEIDNGCEATIMLIRHCEKGDLRSHCNYLGSERAAFLASQFGDADERWPAPSQIYALKPGGRGHKGKTYNFREIETVQFLAEKLHLEVDETYDTSDRNKLVRKLLESILNGDQCGKLTLVSWKHSDLAKLAHLLGCGPFEGCPMDYKGREFDEVWELKYVYRSFHHGPNAQMTYKHWDIFGSVQYEHFDPLAFSKLAGDYPRGGTNHAGRWVDPHQELFD